MISNHTTLVEAHRPASDAIADKIAEFLAAGGTIIQGQSPVINPPPPIRSSRIDPDTILKRRKPSISAAERKALRKLAEAL